MPIAASAPISAPASSPGPTRESPTLPRPSSRFLPQPPRGTPWSPLPTVKSPTPLPAFGSLPHRVMGSRWGWRAGDTAGSEVVASAVLTWVEAGVFVSILNKDTQRGQQVFTECRPPPCIRVQQPARGKQLSCTDTTIKAPVRGPHPMPPAPAPQAPAQGGHSGGSCGSGPPGRACRPGDSVTAQGVVCALGWHALVRPTPQPPPGKVICHMGPPYSL